MSYILEALKKAERERQQGRSPGPTTVQEPGAAPHHPRWVWLLTAALLANAVLLGLFWRRQIPERASAAPAQVVQAAAPASDAVRPTQAPPAAPPASAAGRVPVDEKKPEGIAPRAPAVSDRIEPAQAALPEPDATDASEPEEEPEPAAPPQVPAFVPPPPPALAPKAPFPARLPKEAAPAAAPLTVREPPAAAPMLTAPLMEQLPEAVRESLPAIRVDALLYAERPAERMVFIDGRRYREGDTVSEGLRIEEIRRDGVILSYKGERFMVHS
jgi:general secretion pathway protein B